MVSYEIIFGPITFGLSHLGKRVRRVKIVASKDSEATIFVSTSNTDIGEFSNAREVAAGSELDMQNIFLPIQQGNPAGGLAYRVRISGVGNVQIHEISFDISPRL